MVKRLCMIAIVVLAGGAGAAQGPGDLAGLVNPLIGTANGGNTFPGAVLPFGMFSWSPESRRDNTNPTRAAAPGGYHYDVTRIRGFSLTHLSGTGCRGASGDIPFFPHTGDVSNTSPSTDTKNAIYASDFTHEDESATAGLYKARLKSGVNVELTAALRSGIGRFTYPEGQPATMLVRTSDTQIGSSEASVTIDAPTRTVTGSVTSGNFCGYLSPAGRHSYYTLHFIAVFDRPFVTFGTWQNERVSPQAPTATGGTTYGEQDPPAGQGSGGYVTFAPGSTVNVRVSISYVGLANARANMAEELPGNATVESIARAARAKWNETLRRIEITGGTETERRVFYTALYHSLFHMNVFSDANGEYRGFDGQTHRVRAPQRMQYANFSGWDVYRSQVQLVALLDPKIASDMAQSLLNQASQNKGVWDRWTHNSGATAVMEEDPSPPSVASIAAFGGTDFDMKGALASLVRAATVPTPLDLSNEGCNVMCRGQRPSLDKWLSIRYIPTVSNAWGGAGETLEDVSADFALAQLARMTGDAANHDLFLARSDYWRNIFNPEPAIVIAEGRGRRGDPPPATPPKPIAPPEKPQPGGYIQNRNEDGSWPTLDPASSRGFAEGSSVQYTWMIPFNLAGLIDAMGGTSKTSARLDAFFKRPDGSWALTRSGGLHAELSNEPSIATPWVYLYTGEAHKAQAIVRNVQNTLWKDAPNGIPGNDDLGAMSSWYVWTALGLYPGIPGRAELWITAPLFPRAVVRRANGKTITIETPAASAAAAFIQGLSVNGKPSTRAWLPDSFVREGGTLRFTVSSTPAPSWGAGPTDVPPSFQSKTK